MSQLSHARTSLQSQLNARILLVGNRQSLIEKLPTLRAELEECKTVQECGELPEADPATELWQRITQHKPERIWIVGGDGTINLVGQCALRVPWSLPCWLTPAGTANDLARALTERLTVPTLDNSEPTPGQITICPPVDLDLLSVTLDNNPWARCAANMVTLGTSARNTHHVTAEIKGRWGAFAYLTQIWRAIGDLEPFSMRLTVGQGEPRHVRNIVNLFVANGPYCGGGFRVAPPASLDDQQFNVLILKQGTAAELAHVATAFLTGNHLDHPLVEHFTTNRLTIECEHDSPITLDGEAFNAQRLTIDLQAAHLPISLITTG